MRNIHQMLWNAVSHEDGNFQYSGAEMVELNRRVSLIAEKMNAHSPYEFGRMNYLMDHAHHRFMIETYFHGLVDESPVKPNPALHKTFIWLIKIAADEILNQEW